MDRIEAYRGFPQNAGGSAITRASPEAVWSVVETIGGDNRYFAMNSLWTMREMIDAAFGGPGAVHRRPEGRPLRLGDHIDSWTVVDLRPPHLLALRFGMKAPGRGVLEFVIDPLGEGARLTARAWWEPHGIAGHAYWLAMKPAHVLLFDRLTTEIVRRADPPAPRKARGLAPA